MRSVVGGVSQRRERHLVGAEVEHEFEATDVAPLDHARHGLVMARRRELLANQSAAGRALPRHRREPSVGELRYRETQPYANRLVVTKCRELPYLMLVASLGESGRASALAAAASGKRGLLSAANPPIARFAPAHRAHAFRCAAS